MSNSRNAKCEELLHRKLGNRIVSLTKELDSLVLVLKREDIKEVFRFLRDDTELHFDVLSSLTAIDWLDKKSDRFEMVYHLLSLSNLYRLRIKVAVPEEDPIVDSLLDLWASADYLESECWDMYGINFRGNPDVRRMLMYPEFVGHPLRKDYPVQGKQPRIPMIHPEVRNTATDMVRPSLIQIRKRKEEARA